MTNPPYTKAEGSQSFDLQGATPSSPRASTLTGSTRTTPPAAGTTVRSEDLLASPTRSRCPRRLGGGLVHPAAHPWRNPEPLGLHRGCALPSASPRS